MMAEAEARGIKCTPFPDQETILMEQGNRSWYVRGSRTSLQSSVGKTIADYKPLTKIILNHFNIPTAKSVLIESEDNFDQLNNLKFPVVVKPTSERHGVGVLVGLKDALEVANLFNKSKKPMLVEEMLQGKEYRVVCIDYKLVAVAFRKSAHVIGDGRHTISELVIEKNKHPWRGSGHTNNLSLITVDDSVTSLLSESGYSVDSIPEENTELQLRKTANLSTGGEAWDVSSEVCPENKELFEKIAKVCDLNTVGIDVMCRSLGSPIITQPDAGVIEINASPGLRMHHFPIKGQAVNVAAKILDMVQEKLK